MSEFSIKCPTCGNENEAERTYCWVCYTAFKEKPKSWTPESKPKLPQDYVKAAAAADGLFNKILIVLSILIAVATIGTIRQFISLLFPSFILTMIGFGISCSRSPEAMPLSKRILLGFVTGLSVLGALIALGFITCMGILLFTSHF